MKGCVCKDFTIPDISGEKVKIGSQRFIINAHKPREAEQLIFQLKHRTPLTKLVTLASRDELARGLCFITHSKVVPPTEKDDENSEEESTTRFRFPLGLDPIEETALSEKIEETNEIAEYATKTFEGIFEIFSESFRFSLIKTLQSHLKKARESRERRMSMSDLFESWQNQMIEVTTKAMEKREQEFEQLSRITEAQRLTPDHVYRTMAINDSLKDLKKDYKTYKNIYKHLKETAEVERPQELYDLLKTFSENDISYGSILNSVCLNPKCSNSMVNYGLVPFLEKCPLCNNNIISFYSCNLDEQVNSAWELNLLQEMIMAYILSEQKWVKKVWLHKAILERKNGQNSDSVWVDLIVQTVEDKVIFVDVTTQSDLSNVVAGIQKKSKIFSKSGVDFDGLICVSCSTPLPNYIPIGEAWVLGASHLDKIYSHIEHIYENKIKETEKS